MFFPDGSLELERVETSLRIEDLEKDIMNYYRNAMFNHMAMYEYIIHFPYSGVVFFIVPKPPFALSN